MFNAIDKDKNGYVDLEELKETFSTLGVPLTNSDVAEMMKEANIRGNRIFYEGLKSSNLILLFFAQLLFRYLICRLLSAVSSAA